MKEKDKDYKILPQIYHSLAITNGVNREQAIWSPNQWHSIPSNNMCSFSFLSLYRSFILLLPFFNVMHLIIIY